MDPFLQSGITLVVGLATLVVLVAFVTPMLDRLAGSGRTSLGPPAE